MILMPTSIDMARVARWKQRLPAELHMQFDRYFPHCAPFEPDFNWLMWNLDVSIKAHESIAYVAHTDDLMDAFGDITGYRNPNWKR